MDNLQLAFCFSAVESGHSTHNPRTLHAPFSIHVSSSFCFLHRCKFHHSSQHYLRHVRFDTPDMTHCFLCAEGFQSSLLSFSHLVQLFFLLLVSLKLCRFVFRLLKTLIFHLGLVLFTVFLLEIPKFQPIPIPEL